MKRLWIFLCACASFLPMGRAADNVDVTSVPARAARPAEKRNLDAVEAARLIKERTEITLLDVRTPEEYAAGHVQKALNINYYDHNFQKDAARLDTRKTYLIYCASGNRSSKARVILTQIGITNLYHLDGGIKAWQAASLPIVK
jgi:rhodanese-related sulfurtransferase